MACEVSFNSLHSPFRKKMDGDEEEGRKLVLSMFLNFFGSLSCRLSKPFQILKLLRKNF